MKRIYACLIFLCFTVLWGSFHLTAYGAEEKIHRPLVQTTTFQDEYEGMVYHGGLVSPVLAKADIDRAYENIREGIVRVNTGSFYGSGVIWEMNERELTIISNKHLLINWTNSSSVIFTNGKTAKGEIFKLSDTYDLGFLKVDIKELGYEDLIGLKEIRRDSEAYGSLQTGDLIFTAGSADGAGENMYEGTVADPLWYIEEFGSYMLYGFGFAKPGMSGGGTFDAYGNFIGMLTGGTGGDETASLPITAILEEYGK